MNEYLNGRLRWYGHVECKDYVDWIKLHTTMQMIKPNRVDTWGRLGWIVSNRI